MTRNPNKGNCRSMSACQEVPSFLVTQISFPPTRGKEVVGQSQQNEPITIGGQNWEIFFPLNHRSVTYLDLLSSLIRLVVKISKNRCRKLSLSPQVKEHPPSMKENSYSRDPDMADSFTINTRSKMYSLSLKTTKLPPHKTTKHQNLE